MTDSTTKQRNETEQLSLSLTQVLGSVLAAVSASVAASTFGVAGTVIGAALGSAVATVGSVVYTQSLKRSHSALRQTVGVAAARRLGGRSDDDPGDPPDGRGHRLRMALTPQRLAMGAGALFLLTLGLITAFEILTGQPVAASVDGQHGSGVSVFGGTEKKKSSTPKPSSTPSTDQTSPSSVPSGTSVPTPTVTVTTTPSQAPSTEGSSTPSSGQSAPSESPSTMLSPQGTPSGG
jgi:hypothetical protein